MSFKNASPIVLCFVAAVGVVATALAAVKAKEKIDEELEKAVEENPDLEQKEKAVIVAKCVVAPVLIGTATVGCIFGANALNKKQQATLIAAYPLLERSFKQYKDKVKEVLGVEAHNKVVDAIKKEECNPPELHGPCLFYDTCLQVDGLYEPEIERTFYDQTTGKYFESTLQNVIQAEYFLNRDYTLGKDISVADWKGALGLEVQPGDENVLWFRDDLDGIEWIDFDHELAILDDGMEVITVRCHFDPRELNEIDEAA